MYDPIVTDRNLLDDVGCGYACKNDVGLIGYIAWRVGCDRTLFHQRVHRGWYGITNSDGEARGQQALHHRRTHAAHANKAK